MMFRFFFFNDTATPEISPLSLHDALPIATSPRLLARRPPYRRKYHWRKATTMARAVNGSRMTGFVRVAQAARSEEHTSELQSRQYLVCRLLLEKKKNMGLRHKK